MFARMVRRIADLRATPDDVLIAEHDAAATNTNVGTAYYMDELERRSRERSSAESHMLAMESQRLANRTFWLTVATSVLSLIALSVSVIALLA
jgi:hypothetical protein